MLFNSFEFIFFFLPIVFVGFFWTARSSHRLAALWLAVASLFFYGWWNPQFVLLLLVSISFNYAMGYAIGHARVDTDGLNRAKWLLAAAIACNLALLGYFKYFNFLLGAASQLVGAKWALADIILPLGISFFTFTQIAFLVDTYRGIAREYNLIHYLLFVTYFPHLIAGPVLHHKQMMPQFGNSGTYKSNINNVSIGLTIFTVGLFKKVILADQFALYANPIFAAAADGGNPKFLEAWIGALAYSLQLYFDFSGYSDMAIGVSRIFNVTLPLNFNSPYKATSVIEFWKRWHMTLSTFLRDYLYVPLGGSRRGISRRYANLMMTMLLGGLWHGAGWTFVIWGGLHGIFLVINHGWRRLTGTKSPTAGWRATVGIALTFAAVVVAWVPFRAINMDSALRIWVGMFGLNGVSLPQRLEHRLSEWIAPIAVFDGITPLAALQANEIVLALLFGLAVVWLLPNTQQLAAHIDDGRHPEKGTLILFWKPSAENSLHIGLITGLIFVFSLMHFNKYSPFLYFQF